MAKQQQKKIKTKVTQQPNNAPAKPKLKDAVEKKQQSEIILLVLILIIIAVLIYFFTIKPSGDESDVKIKSPIQTEFNANALEQIKTRDTSLPAIDTNDAGKSNPFSQE